jgi:hypothetical protein
MAIGFQGCCVQQMCNKCATPMPQKQNKRRNSLEIRLKLTNGAEGGICQYPNNLSYLFSMTANPTYQNTSFWDFKGQDRNLEK